jgi:hypothetical protein
MPRIMAPASTRSQYLSAQEIGEAAEASSGHARRTRPRSGWPSSLSRQRTSWGDHCSNRLAGSPQITTTKTQAAASSGPSAVAQAGTSSARAGFGRALLPASLAPRAGLVEQGTESGIWPAFASRPRSGSRSVLATPASPSCNSAGNVRNRPGPGGAARTAARIIADGAEVPTRRFHCPPPERGGSRRERCIAQVAGRSALAQMFTASGLPRRAPAAIASSAP